MPTITGDLGDIDNGFVYVNDIKVAVVSIDSEYRTVSQNGNGKWIDVLVEDGAGGEAGSSGQDKYDDRGGRAVYGADVASASPENAVKKLLFFSMLAAAVIALGLLSFFKILK